MKTKVLIIGAGNRAKGAIIPALYCLRDKFEIEAIYSRSVQDLSLMGSRFNMKTIVDFAQVNFKDISLIMLAVTITEVPNVLRQLSRYDTRHMVLMLDTPVLALKGFLAQRFFKRFKRVLVSEDTIALPPFVVAKKIIDEGGIGKVKNIYFFHNGYKYHALASLKMLAGEHSLPHIVNRKYEGGIMLKEMSFQNGIRAFLYEPRDYSNCKFLIEGEKGAIADYDIHWENLHKIEYEVDGLIYKGLFINGQIVPKDDLDRAYESGIGNDIWDASFMNTMKIRGLIELISESINDNSPYHYKASKAIWDNFSIIISEKLGYF